MKQNRVHITPDVPSFQIEDKLQPLFDAIRKNYQDASEKRKTGVVTLLNKILRWLE